MAQQQSNTGNTSTQNMLTGGMVKDNIDLLKKEHSYSHARNATVVLSDGQRGAILELIDKAKNNTTYSNTYSNSGNFYIDYKSNSFIYLIHNTLNDSIYIGSTVTGKKRRKSHFKDLRANKHHSHYLQRSFNLHGEEYFFFYVIEYLFFPKDMKCHIIDEYIESIEEFYIQKYNPVYNSRKHAKMRHGYSMKEMMGVDRYDEYIEKKKKFLKESGHAEKMREYNKNREFTQEMKDKISNSLKGKILSKEVIEKIRQKQIGSKRSEGAKTNISNGIRKAIADGKMKFNKKGVIGVDSNLVEHYFESLTSAAKYINSHGASICNAIKSNQNLKGYKWRYEE